MCAVHKNWKPCLLYLLKVFTISNLSCLKVIIENLLGATPVVRVLRDILRAKKQEIKERRLLILLATDGAPTDDQGRPKVEELKHFLHSERRPIDRIPVTIIACTGNFDMISKES